MATQFIHGYIRGLIARPPVIRKDFRRIIKGSKLKLDKSHVPALISMQRVQVHFPEPSVITIQGLHIQSPTPVLLSDLTQVT